MKRLLLSLLLLGTQAFSSDAGAFIPEPIESGAFIPEPAESDASIAGPTPPNSRPKTPISPSEDFYLESSDEEIMALLEAKGNRLYLENYKTRKAREKKKSPPVVFTFEDRESDDELEDAPFKSILKKPGQPKTNKGNIKFNWIQDPLDAERIIIQTDVKEIPPAKDRILEMGDMHGLEKQKDAIGNITLKRWMGRNGIDWEKIYREWKPADHVKERILTEEEQAEAIQTDHDWRSLRYHRSNQKDAALPRKMRVKLENKLLTLPEEEHEAEINRMLHIFQQELLLKKLTDELTRNNAAVLDVLEQLDPDTEVERM